MYTGNIDEVILIIHKLFDGEICVLCQINKDMNGLCGYTCWMNRVDQRFGEYLGTPTEIKKKYLENKVSMYVELNQQNFGLNPIFFPVSKPKDIYKIGWKNYYKLLISYLKKYPKYISQSCDRSYKFYSLNENIKREDVIKVLDVKKLNTEVLQHYSEINDFNTVKEIINQTDEILIYSPVSYCTSDVDIMKYLLKIGIKINIDDLDINGEEIIGTHIEENRYDIVKLLIKNDILEIEYG